MAKYLVFLLMFGVPSLALFAVVAIVSGSLLIGAIFGLGLFGLCVDVIFFGRNDKM